MSKHFNECPYGVGLYVDRLLDEKITLNKQLVLDHVNNGDVHVTLEDKERWNSTSEAVFSSSDTDEEGNVTIDIPTDISAFNNDVPYVSLSDMSVYATEDEVKTWLAGYLSKAEYDEIKALEEAELGEPDPDIIDKFSISNTKASLANAKKVYLDFNAETGVLSVKTAAAQTASLSYTGDGIEYKQAGSSTITATYTDSDMVSVVLKHGANSVKTMPDKDNLSQDATDKQYTVSYTQGEFLASDTYALHYTPTEDTAVPATTTIPVLKRWYLWYGGDSSSNTLTTSGGTLASGKPGSISVSASAGQYIYLAFPKSWSVNTANFKVGGFEFGHTTLSDVNGPYGESNDYTVIRSSLTGINGTINT